MAIPASRLAVRALVPLLFAVSALGCSEEVFDEDVGGMDLTPFYYDDAGRYMNPPNTLGVVNSWFNGQQAHYYDFNNPANYTNGQNNTAYQSGPLDAVTAAATGQSYGPKYAPILPMYFFFNSKGKPLFSRPARENRTWQFYMRGGKNVLKPNPKDGDDDRKVWKDVAYPVRLRDPLTDPNRNTADYQRPIIDDLPGSGLWEIVRVTVPDDYEVDSVKSYATLKPKLESGEWKYKRTGKVVNCGVVDDRTYVTPSIMEHDKPHPRVEIWFRRKRGTCFLAGGWEALGRIDRKDESTVDDDEYVLYNADEDDQRLNIMDVQENVIGVGKTQVRQLVSPLGRLFIPKMSVDNGGGASYTLRWPQVAIAEGALPRKDANSPPGYRPIRWIWDINEPQRVPFSANRDDFLKDARIFDSNQTSPTGLVKNFPMLGIAPTCEELRPKPGATIDRSLPDPCARLGLQCLALTGSSNFVCAEKTVRYGGYCAPAVTRCSTDVRSTDQIEGKLFNKNNGFFPQNPMDTNLGYTCHGGAGGTGHCYIKCYGDLPNRLVGSVKEITFDVTNPVTNETSTKSWKLPLDSRCGGESLPGYQCLPISDPYTEKGGRVCLKVCNIRNPLQFNKALCQQEQLFDLADDAKGLNLSEGTQCRTASSITACIKDVAFEPRE